MEDQSLKQLEEWHPIAIHKMRAIYRGNKDQKYMAIYHRRDEKKYLKLSWILEREFTDTDSTDWLPQTQLKCHITSRVEVERDLGRDGTVELSIDEAKAHMVKEWRFFLYGFDSMINALTGQIVFREINWPD